MADETGFVRVFFAYIVLAALVFAIIAGGVVMGSSFIDSRLVDVGESVSKRETIAADGIDAAMIEVIHSIGQLRIEGGGSDLIAGEFTYNVPELTPTIIYSDSGDFPLVTVTHPETKFTLSAIPRPSQFNQVLNIWDLSLNREVALDLHVTMGAAEGELTLSGLNLHNLLVEIGTGMVLIDLSGDWSHNVQVEVDGGVGELILLLPETVGVRVESHAAMSEVTTIGLEKEEDVYTNEIYGSADVELDVEVNAGLGSIHLEVVTAEEEM